jgi:hypothetical protein
LSLSNHIFVSGAISLIVKALAHIASFSTIFLVSKYNAKSFGLLSILSTQQFLKKGVV